MNDVTETPSLRIDPVNLCLWRRDAEGVEENDRREYSPTEMRRVTEREIMRALGSRLLTALVSFVLSACSVNGAPSFTIVGAYFPGWMFCAAVGIASAIVARIGFVASGLAAVLPFQLFVCSAVSLSSALLAWLLWFG